MSASISGALAERTAQHTDGMHNKVEQRMGYKREKIFVDVLK